MKNIGVDFYLNLDYIIGGMIYKQIYDSVDMIKTLFPALIFFLLIPTVSAQNWWVDSFDLVSVSEIDEFSPDGDAWKPGEKIPFTYTVRSEDDNAEYVYTFAKSSDDYWLDVEPWARLVPAGDTVTYYSHIIATDTSGRQLVNVCILDDRTDAGYEVCKYAGYAEFEGDSTSLSDIFYMCCCLFAIAIPIGIGSTLGSKI